VSECACVGVCACVCVCVLCVCVCVCVCVCERERERVYHRERALANTCGGVGVQFKGERLYYAKYNASKKKKLLESQLATHVSM